MCLIFSPTTSIYCNWGPCHTNTNTNTITNTITNSTMYVFSGAGGPITNFGHQLLLPTQFSFGPGTPGQYLSSQESLLIY